MSWGIYCIHGAYVCSLQHPSHLYISLKILTWWDGLLPRTSPRMLLRTRRTSRCWVRLRRRPRSPRIPHPRARRSPSSRGGRTPRSRLTASTRWVKLMKAGTLLDLCIFELLFKFNKTIFKLVLHVWYFYHNVTSVQHFPYTAFQKEKKEKLTLIMMIIKGYSIFDFRSGGGPEVVRPPPPPPPFFSARTPLFFLLLKNVVVGVCREVHKYV